MDLCVGILEVQGLGPAFMLADQVLKVATVEIPGIELNSLGGLTIKIVGSSDDVLVAVEHGSRLADSWHVPCRPTTFLRYSASARWLIYCQPRYSAIIQDRTQLLPHHQHYPEIPFAIGVLETHGFIGVIAGADAMLKAAEVHLIGKEKIGAAYADVLVRGDLASVQEALEAGKRVADQVGTLVGGYVIARPHPDLLPLLPDTSSMGTTDETGSNAKEENR